VSTATSIALEERVVRWLVNQDHPGIRYLALRDLLDRSANDPEVSSYRNQIASHGAVVGLFAEQHPDGYWGHPEDCYWPKWQATVWPLILLAEMGLPGNHPRVRAACLYYLKTAMTQDKSWPPPDFPEGDLTGYRLLWEPCVTGNMARTLVEFGYHEDPRVQEMFDWLVRTQLPDGGWNCEPGPWGKEVHHSSFMSTIEPLWAFSALEPDKWPKGGREAVERGCEFLLMHRVYKSDRDGRVVNEEWTKLHFPLFYFYDILHALRVLTDLGYGNDERTEDALELLQSKRLPDGSWPMEASFLEKIKRNFAKDPATGQWREISGQGIAQIPPIYSSLGSVGGPNPWVTLNALRVLKGVHSR
jgi:hypothetical protein